MAKKRRVDPGRSRERNVGFSQTKPSLLGVCQLMELISGPSTASTTPPDDVSTAADTGLRNPYGVSGTDPRNPLVGPMRPPSSRPRIPDSEQAGVHAQHQQAGVTLPAAQLHLPGIDAVLTQEVSSNPAASNHFGLSAATSATDQLKATQHQSAQAGHVSISPNPQLIQPSSWTSRTLVTHPPPRNTSTGVPIHPRLPHVHPHLQFLLQESWMPQFPSFDRFSKLVAGTLRQAMQIQPYIEVFFPKTPNRVHVLLQFQLPALEQLGVWWHYDSENPQLSAFQVHDFFGYDICRMIIERDDERSFAKLYLENQGCLVHLVVDFWSMLDRMDCWITELSL